VQIQFFLYSKYFRSEIQFLGVQRVEVPPIPEIIMRELVVNAICHKEYASSIPVTIKLYRRKVSIINPGTWPEENVPVSKVFEDHFPDPHNPHIALALYKCGFVESYGSGLVKVGNICKTSHLPLPVFHITPKFVEISLDMLNPTPEFDYSGTTIIADMFT
jgi:ATP-dependent DNA helicase RecG